MANENFFAVRFCCSRSSTFRVNADQPHGDWHFVIWLSCFMVTIDLTLSDFWFLLLLAAISVAV